MTADLSHQELQLELLTTQAQRYITTFRCLWLFNLAAAIVGIATHHYALTGVAAGSSLVALIGVASARRGQTTVSETTVECHRIQHELEPNEAESSSMERKPLEPQEVSGLAVDLLGTRLRP